ncbi:MAG TPA: hypothetical protein PKE04_13695, partial [Clostridia bacterium]|nr:hypothetical protein [Clostridia bacterium]
MYKLTAVRILCCFLVTVLLAGMGFAALADGARPAGGGAVHWRLQSVKAESTPFSAKDYEGEAAYGLEETQAGDAQALAYLTLKITQSGNVELEERYVWDVLPEALEPNVEYLVSLSGSVSAASGGLSSTLSLIVASERVQRVKAGEEAVQAAFSVPKSLPETLDIQLVLRDGQEWGQATVTYHYVRYDGPVPVPTPEPIVFAARTPEAAPDYYIPVPEVEGLFVVEDSEPLRYRLYGAFGSGNPAYYPADAEGTLIGEDPASEEPVREPAFILQEPDALPEPYQQIAEGLYGFEDADGRIQYRVYGAFPDTQKGFYRANAFGVVTDRAPIDPAEDMPEPPEGFVPSVPKDSDAYPTQEGVSLWFFIDRDGNTHYRSYGSLNGGAEAFYPADADGNVALDALPVTPGDDFVQYIQGFVSISPSGQLPLFYEAVVGEDGQLFWRFEGRDGQMVYRVYGKLDGSAAAFYPADERGKLLEGAAAVTPTEDYINHIRGFVAMAYTPTAYDFYEPVEGSDGSLWRFMDAYDQWQYRRYGSLHRGLPAFYPSDETGAVTDDAVPVARDRDRAMLPVFTQEAPAQVPAHYVQVEDGFWRVMLAEPYVYRIYGAWSHK